MAFSYQNYVGDNATTTFSIPFTYTDTSEISVTVDGVAETGLTFPSSSTVTLTTAPASSTLVQVRRTTSLTSRSVDFASGSVLTEEDLDNSNIQVYHAAQEAVDKANDGITLDADDKWDAQSKVIKNVANPVADTDAVNKQFISTNLPNITTVAGIASDVTTVAGISTDVTAVADDATDIGTVSTNIANVNTVAGISANVTTVAGNDANVTAVAGNATNINTVAGISTDVTTVAGISTDVSAVEDIASNVTAVAGNATNINAVAGNATNINNVASNSTNINAVAADATDIGTVAGISANVSTVAGISANVTTVAGNDSNITAVAGNATNINSVASVSSDVTTVAGISSDVTTVADDGTDIGTVAGISSDVTTVAGISGNVTTVAGVSANVTTVAGISADVSTVAGDSAAIQAVAADATDIGTVATNIANVNAVGGDIANVNTTAANIADVNNFASTYRIGATDPTTSLDEGDLFYNTTSNSFKYYNGSSWASIESGLTAIVSDTTPQLGGDLASNGNDIIFADNDKAIFGAGSDLQVYHSGSHSFIEDTGTGNLYLATNGTSVRITKGPQNAENMAAFNVDGSAVLYYDNAAKIATTATGVDVTGGLTTTGDVGIGTSSPSGKLNLATGASTSCELRFTSNNTGSGAGNSGKIVVYSARNDGTAYEAGKIEIDRSTGTTDEAHILFATNGGSGNTERMRIASDGTVTVTSEGGAVTTSVQQGLCKQWINFSGSGAIAIRDSFNTTSITDNGTGNYTVTIANDMSNNQWAAFLTADLNDSAGGIYTNNPDIHSRATGSYGIGTYNNSNFADLTIIRSGLFGDLA